MKKLCLFPVFLFAGFLLFAQSSQQQKIDSVCRLIQAYFNEKNPVKIYELTGDAFRKEISAEAFQNIFEKNLLPLGELKNTVFENHHAGLSKYKAQFGTINLSLLLSLDNKDKIGVFLFKPYTDESAKKNYHVPSTNPLTTALDKEVDSAIGPYINLQATVGLSIGILKDGKLFFYGYGETARGNKQIPDEHTLFEIGSLTKTFTSILLADAVNSGKVKLEDPINLYLPDSIPPLTYEGIPITLKTLANHSSGIPRMPSNFNSSQESDPYKDYDQNDLFSFYRNFKPTRKPGEKYEYSNLAAGTLGVILERVNKTAYEKLFITTICKPLHMEETREFLKKEDSLRFARGYTEEGEYSAAWNFQALGAAVCIRSSSSDLMKYAMANLGNAPGRLNKDIELTHVISFTEGKTRVGLAWHYIKPGMDDLIFHNGQTGGYHTYLAINSRKKFALVILSNCAKGTEDIGAGIMKWAEINN
jgi:CubicO group peptidase (beta-lactamase class C family)